MTLILMDGVAGVGTCTVTVDTGGAGKGVAGLPTLLLGACAGGALGVAVLGAGEGRVLTVAGLLG